MNHLGQMRLCILQCTLKGGEAPPGGIICILLATIEKFEIRLIALSGILGLFDLVLTWTWTWIWKNKKYTRLSDQNTGRNFKMKKLGSELVVQRFPSTKRKFSASSFEWAWSRGSVFSKDFKSGIFIWFLPGFSWVHIFEKIKNLENRF